MQKSMTVLFITQITALIANTTGMTLSGFNVLNLIGIIANAVSLTAFLLYFKSKRRKER